MSTISTAIIKLEQLITENHVEPKVEETVKIVLSLLKDRTILFLEWNEIDIQVIARQRIAQMYDVKESEIKEKPLPRELVIDVIDLLDKYNDCNYGISWDTIRSTMDMIEFGDLEEYLIGE